MKKVFKSMLFVAMSLIVAVGLTACSEDEVKPKDKTKRTCRPQTGKGGHTRLRGTSARLRRLSREQDVRWCKVYGRSAGVCLHDVRTESGCQTLRIHLISTQ